MRFSVWQSDTYAVSLHKPHADTHGFLYDYIRLTGLSTITGGAGADVLTGGAGADVFVYTTLTDSLAAAPDTITDFTSGTDDFSVGATKATAIGGAGGLLQGAGYTTAGTGTLATDIAAAITAGGGTLIANGAAVVTITGTGAGTYLVINNGTAGYVATDDAVVLLGGTSSTTLAAGDFIA